MNLVCGVLKLDKRVTDKQPFVNLEMLFNVNAPGVSFIFNCLLG